MEESCFLDAVRNLKTETVFRLLKQGESLDQRNSSGETALIIVAKESTVHTSSSAARKIFTELINYGADPNKRDALGKTALMHATMSLSKILDLEIWPSDRYVLETLILNGADVTVKDTLGKSALDVASDNSSGRCLDILLNAYYNVDALGSLFTSIKMGRFDFCLRHINSCRDLCTTDKDGNTLLMLTIRHFNTHKQKDTTDFIKMCEKMILFGTDLNVQNNKGMTALMLLFLTRPAFDDTSLLQLFANDGAKLDVKDKNGNTALIHAMNAKAARSVVWLLLQGANPYIGFNKSQVIIRYITEPGDEITCMHINRIIRAKQYSLLRLLVVNGVIDMRTTTMDRATDCIEVQNNSSDAFITFSPFMFALINKRLGIAKYLLANCYLTSDDLRFRPGHPVEAFLPPESTVLLRDLHSQPWPLVKLAFVAVSSIVGCYPERHNRIEALKIPQRLKSMLNFQDHAGFLSVSNWKNITIYTSDYDRINAGRPLLYYWPCGKSSLLVQNPVEGQN